MRRSFSSTVNSVIEQSDIVLEVIDARFPEETRNHGLEKRIITKGKKIIVVINKSDLAGVERVREAKKKIAEDFPTVFVSSKPKRGRIKLMEEMGKAAESKKIVVGIIGYPNTGKSSVINMLKGKKVARTSRKAGFTRGQQFARVNENVMLIDSPGVMPIRERDEFKLFLVGSKNPQDLSDKELIAIQLIEFIAKQDANILRKKYGLEHVGTGEEVLEHIAVKRKKMKKGRKPDIEVAARIVLEDWGKLHLV